MGDGRGENACKAFSKDLIVRAIPRNGSLFQTPKEFPLKEACFPASRWMAKEGVSKVTHSLFNN